MLKSVEMKRNLQELTDAMAALNKEGKIKEAYNKLDEIKELKNQIAVQEELEAQEKARNEAVEGYKPMEKIVVDSAKIRNQVFNKQIMGKALTEEEMKYATALVDDDGEVVNVVGTPGQVGATPAKGGYLMPEEQFGQVTEFRRQCKSLKELCQVIPVSRRNGKMPTCGDNDAKLTAFDEISEIAQSDIDFGQTAFSVKSYGDIIPVSNELLADIDVNLMGLIGSRFARKAIRTENAAILALMKTLSPVAITDVKGIKKAYTETLDPAIGETAKIITNQTGLLWLDTLEDQVGRPLLQPMPTDATKLTLGGHEVVVFSNATIPMNEKKAPFFVGDLAQFCGFFDRQTVEIAVSQEAGFTKNATMVRAIERFDAKKLDEKALVLLEFDTTSMTL